MSFRIPLQISRAVSKTRPCTPRNIITNNPVTNVTKIISRCSTPIADGYERRYGKIGGSPRQVLLPNQTTYTFPLSINSNMIIQRFKSTNPENRKKVRQNHKCDDDKVEEKLVFRQTTLEECQKCGCAVVVDKCPELKRLNSEYDDTKLKWKCKKPKVETKPPRIDDVQGLKVNKKLLPKLKSKDCKECVPVVLKNAPKLRRLPKIEDKQETNYKNIPCESEVVECVARMDDVQGVQVTPKTLPTIPVGDCSKCTEPMSKKLPKLKRPKARYDSSEIKKVCKVPVVVDCNIPRLDQSTDLNPPPQKLPTILKNDCVACTDVVYQTSSAKMKIVDPNRLAPPKKIYQPCQMKWKHVKLNVETCDKATRLDEQSRKVDKKQLPNLNLNDGTKCIRPIPKEGSKLHRLVKLYDEKDIKKICKDADADVKIEKPPKRLDEIYECKITKSELPEFIESDCPCPPDTTPTIAPELVQPDKCYDDSELQWKHKKQTVTCIASDRLDSLTGDTVKQKQLPNMFNANDCNVCHTIRPEYLPPLRRLKKAYDPSIMKYKYVFCIKKDNDCAPRLDQKITIIPKILPKLNNNCLNCIPETPKTAPKLRKLKAKYDSSKLQWKHHFEKENICDYKRLDFEEGLNVQDKLLPKFLSLGNCEKCQSIEPTYAPELVRLKPNPKHKKEDKKCQEENLCDLDPPRLDDVNCWKPKKKILPTFLSSIHKRNYCTINLKNKFTYLIYTNINYIRLRQRAKIYSRMYCDKINFNPTKGAKQCKSFKLKDCKPKAKNTDCHRVDESECTKLEAPYSAYGDKQGDMCPPKLTECPNGLARLQPKNAYSHMNYDIILKAPPPAFRVVDPELQRQCEKHQQVDCSSGTKKKPFKSPCKQFKLQGCKPRARTDCTETHDEQCEKLEAPYKSFTDNCPQFPDLEPSECDLAEDFARKQKILYKIETNIKKKKSVCSDDQTDQECSCECDTNDKQSKSNQSDCKKTKKTSGASSNASTMTNKRFICICKPKGDRHDSTNKANMSSLRNSCCFTLPYNSYKQNSTVKHQSSKCNQECDSDSDNEEKERRKMQAKCKRACSCCCNVQEVKCKQNVSKQTLWERICNYFKARPNCPAPDEWKKKLLREKAEKAAAAAGLTLCEPPQKCKPNRPRKKQPPCCCAEITKQNKTKCKPTTKCITAKPITNINDPIYSITRKCFSTQQFPLTDIQRNDFINKTKNTKNTNDTTIRNKNNQMSKKDDIKAAGAVPATNKGYLRLSNNYIGKIYKLKLTKIGLRNTLVTNPNLDEPYTICHICKVIPKHKQYNQHIYSNSNTPKKPQ